MHSGFFYEYSTFYGYMYKQVSTLELCGDSLYLGTEDGMLIEYSFPTTLPVTRNSSATMPQLRRTKELATVRIGNPFGIIHKVMRARPIICGTRKVIQHKYFLLLFFFLLYIFLVHGIALIVLPLVVANRSLR